MQGKYSKVLLNSSRSKQSLRLDRMVALATANHLPSYCDTSVQTDPVQTHNRLQQPLPNDVSTTTNCGLPVTNKHNVCVTTRRDKQGCSSSAPAACGVSVATGCNSVVVAACGKSANPASVAAVHQRHSKVFVSNGGVQCSTANGNKSNGCSERLSTGANMMGCKRLSSGATVAKQCNPKRISSPDCGQGVSKPASTIVTVAAIVTEPSKRESCVSTATVTLHNPTSDEVKPRIENNREPDGKCKSTQNGVILSQAPSCSDGKCKSTLNGVLQSQAPSCNDGRCNSTQNGVLQSQAPSCNDGRCNSTQNGVLQSQALSCNDGKCNSTQNGALQSQAPNKRYSGNCSKRSSTVECNDAATPSATQEPKLEVSDENHLQIVGQEEEVVCATKADLVGSAPPNQLQSTMDSVVHNSTPPATPPIPNNINGDCDKSHPPSCFTFDIPPSSGCAPSDKHQDPDSECLNFDLKEVGNHHHHHRNQRSVHTVPKHGVNSGSKQNEFAERCSSDYERNSPASDLEVNMESEADIHALNASEEELGRDLGRSRLFFHNNYESSVDTTDSESSVSSHEHDHLLIDRLKSQHCLRPMDSSVEGNEAGGGCGGPVELDWEKFSCPFNFTALDHTFTLNPYDVIYASKYLARNQSKTDAQEEEGANGEGPPGGHDQYPYDPDPDATVV